MSGAVWAINGTWLDVPVTGNGRRALLVVELHSRNILCLDSVPGERAGAAVACLRRLIATHGPPLVLKADNGSAFRSKALTALCSQHGITLMHSPIRRPRFNGTCEVSGRWAKGRAQAAAQLRGSPDRLTQDDLDCGVTHREMARVDEALRVRFRAAVAAQLAAVVTEQGLARIACLGEHVRRSLGRVAVQRALLDCHILTIEGRPYRQWLPSSVA